MESNTRRIFLELKMLDEVRICSWHSRGQMLVGICQIIVRNEGRYCKGRRRRGSDGAGRGLRNGGDCDLPSAGRGEGVQGGSKEGGGGSKDQQHFTRSDWKVACRTFHSDQIYKCAARSVHSPRTCHEMWRHSGGGSFVTFLRPFHQAAHFRRKSFQVDGKLKGLTVVENKSGIRSRPQRHQVTAAPLLASLLLLMLYAPLLTILLLLMLCWLLQTWGWGGGSMTIHSSN